MYTQSSRKNGRTKNGKKSLVCAHISQYPGLVKWNASWNRISWFFGVFFSFASMFFPLYKYIQQKNAACLISIYVRRGFFPPLVSIFLAPVLHGLNINYNRKVNFCLIILQTITRKRGSVECTHVLLCYLCVVEHVTYEMFFCQFWILTLGLLFTKVNRIRRSFPQILRLFISIFCLKYREICMFEFEDNA